MRSPCLALLLLALIAPLDARATVGIWQPVGPDAGDIRVLVPHPSDPSVAYAATRQATIWSTADGGAHWQYVGAIARAVADGRFSSGPELDAFAVDRSSPTTLYAAVGAQIHRSLDGGHTWTARGTTSRARSVRQLVTMTGVAPTLLALVTPAEIGEAPIQRSIDGGLEWTDVLLPPRDDASPTVASVIAFVAGSLSSRLWVVTSDDVLQSDNAGVSWVHRLLPSTGVGAFAPSLSSTSTFYFVGGAGHVYASTDSGNHWEDRGPWTVFNQFVSATLLRFVVDAQDPNVLYLLDEMHIPRRDERRLLVSLDAGLSWRQVADPVAQVKRATQILSLAAPGDPLLLAGESEALALSLDHGESFGPSHGLQAPPIDALALPQRPPAILYAGRSSLSTLFTSVDAGSTWRHLDFFPPPFPPVRLTDLEVDPRDPTTIWGALDLFLFKSDSQVQKLEHIEPAGFLSANLLALAPSDPQTVYAVPSPSRPTDDACGFEKSTDGGATWSCERRPPLLGIARALAVDPLDPRRVYVADEGRRLVRTIDGAANWEVVDDDLDVTALAVDPLRPAIVWAGTSDQGVWRSTDRGTSWLRLAAADLPAGPIADVAPHPVDPDVVYVSQTGTGVFVSRDGGTTFAPLGAGLPTAIVSGPLAIDPRVPSVVYAATRGGGLWRIVDEQAAAACVEDEWTLCLGGGRFAAQARWRDFQGRSGPGRAVPLTGDTGYFWFFSPDNLELMVKALDARIVNDRYWVFYGALSNVEFELVVTDTVTGEVNAYFNPERSFASRGDTSAFPRPPSAAARATGSGARGNSGALADDVESTQAPTANDALSARTICLPDDATLCVRDGRFRVRVEWKNFRGGTGIGHAEALNETTGTFWFFNDTNLELAIKILDGRAINGYYWVFYGALSNVEYRITVEDTVTGRVRTYFNPLQQFASRGDTAAFADP